MKISQFHNKSVSFYERTALKTFLKTFANKKERKKEISITQKHLIDNFVFIPFSPPPHGIKHSVWLCHFSHLLQFPL